MSSFAALWFSLRGLSGLYVGGVIAVANFVAVTISFGAIDFVKDPTASVAAFAALVLAATGSAIRVNARYHAEAAARLLTMEESRASEIQREIAQERLRVARDLHDSVGHQIAVVSMRLGSAEVHLPPGAEAARADLDGARTALQSVLRETQEILRVLRDDDAAPTVPARRPSIRHLIAGLRDAGMHLDADVQEFDDIPADVALTAYPDRRGSAYERARSTARGRPPRVEVAAGGAISSTSLTPFGRFPVRDRVQVVSASSACANAPRHPGELLDSRGRMASSGCRRASPAPGGPRRLGFCWSMIRR